MNTKLKIFQSPEASYTNYNFVVNDHIEYNEKNFRLKVVNFLQYYYNIIGYVDVYINDCLYKSNIPVSPNVTIPYFFNLKINKIFLSISLTIEPPVPYLEFIIIEN